LEGPESIGEFLSRHIPKQFLLNVEALFLGALERAAKFGAGSAPGHRANVVGTLRHFALNEALELALKEAEAPHAELRGNRIMFGSVGDATVARVHLNTGPWNNSKRSKAKLALCEKNLQMMRNSQPDLLEDGAVSLLEVTCFFVTQHSGRVEDPGMIHLVVPDVTMDLQNPLFAEPLVVFLRRYEQMTKVVDIAVPRLKTGVRRAADEGEDVSRD
jgi:hypothetical protein